MEARRIRHVLHAVAFLVGIVAFAILLERLGSDGLRRVLLGIGWWFLVIAAIDLASVFSDAAAVYSFVRPHVRVSYWRVFAAQASGTAINRLTPSNSFGEPIKVTMLMAARVPEAAAVSTILKYNLTTFLVSIASITIGVTLTIAVSDLSGRLQIIVGGATAVLVVLACALVMLARRGALGSLIGAGAALRVLSPARAARWRVRIAAIDNNVQQLGGPAGRRAFGFAATSRLLNWTGTLVLLHATDIPLTAPLVIGMLSVGLLVTWISNIIPLGMGLADGGNYMLYRVLGASPVAGLDYTMIYRARVCVLAAMGLTIFAIANIAERLSRER